MSQENKIRVSPEVINVDFLPAFRQLAQVVMPGKLAYAIGKNMQACLRIIRNVDKEHYEIIRRTAVLDANGNPKQVSSDSGNKLEFISPELEKEYSDLYGKLVKEPVEMVIHQFSETTMAALPQSTPLAMVALEPFFFKGEAAAPAPDAAPTSMRVIKDDVPSADKNDPADDATDDLGGDTSQNDDQEDELRLRVPSIDADNG